MIKFDLIIVVDFFSFNNLTLSISFFEKMRFNHRGEDG
jgi:hypothetical protein